MKRINYHIFHPQPPKGGYCCLLHLQLQGANMSPLGDLGVNGRMLNCLIYYA